jgi:O-antigen/teichoic acid export membrane protein
LAAPFLTFIKAPAAGHSDYLVMSMLLVGAAAMATFNNTFRGPLIGLQRMDIFNAIELAASVTFVVLAVCGLHFGYGVRGLAFAAFAQTALPLPLLVIALRQLMPDVPLTPASASRATMKVLLRFGMPVAAPSAAIVFQGQAERIIMSRLLGPGTVGYYSFGARISEVWRGVVQNGMLTLVPATAGLGAVGQHDRVRQLYTRATKFVLAIVFAIGMFFFAVTPVLMVAWMGAKASAGYGTSMRALRFLSIATMAYLAPSVGIGVARGMNVLKPDVASSIIIVVGELTLGILLGREYGYVGILAATVITMTLASVTSIAVVHRMLRFGGIAEILGLYGTPLAIAVLASLPIGLFNHARRLEIVHAGNLTGRLLRLAPLGVAEMVVFGALFLLLVRLSRYLTAEDVKSLRTAARGARTAHLEPEIADRA